MVEMIKGIIKKTYYYRKNRKKNVKIGKRCVIGGFDTKFEGNNRVGDFCFFHGELGYGSYIGNNCHIDGSVGRYCSIADNVKTVIGKHPTSQFVSTHPAFDSNRQQAGFTYSQQENFEEFSYADEFKHHIVIGNDVWIGYGAVLLGGITIGDGAIIATGAVVTKDVEPYSIVGGVPAKEIKKRFAEKDIEKLLSIKWWGKDRKWIQNNVNQFKNIELFLKSIQENEV